MATRYYIGGNMDIQPGSDGGIGFATEQDAIDEIEQIYADQAINNPGDTRVFYVIEVNQIPRS